MNRRMREGASLAPSIQHEQVTCVLDRFSRFSIEIGISRTTELCQRIVSIFASIETTTTGVVAAQHRPHQVPMKSEALPNRPLEG